ncbi:MAG: YncE family protein [Candidatus Eremiobacterales bacterium]
MIDLRRTILASAAAIALCGAAPSASPVPSPSATATVPPGAGALIASPPVVVPRSPGYFDYMTVDGDYRRLLVAHADSDQLAIIDVDAGTVIQAVDLGNNTGGAGVAVDTRDGKYFVGTAANRVVDINRKNMVLQQYITLPGPVDAIVFDPKNDTLYADEDHGSHVWAIDAKHDKLVASIALPGDPEYVDYDPVSNRVYQNIKPAPSLVVAIDPGSNTIAARWPVAPAVSLHGLAIDSASGRVFSVGLNGKLAVIDVKTGAIVTEVDVAGRVDQIAFDPATKRVYCPSGSGVLTVVQETDAGASVLDTITVPRGTHSLAVDPKTHDVWISYGAPDGDYVEKLIPTNM